MKKFAIVMAVAMVLAMILSVGSSAFIGGTRDKYEWSVPHINAENPAINFDGEVDLEGEWNGALCVTIDASDDADNLEELTIWDPAVWGGEWNLAAYDELPDEWKITINTYFLWDEAGLYIASKCDDLGVFNGLTTTSTKFPYWEGALDSYEGFNGNIFEPMICPTDAEDAYVNNNGGKWPELMIGTIEGGNQWLDGTVASGSNWETSTYNAEAGNPDTDNKIAKQIKCYSTITTTPDADGFYHWGLEVFLPWDYINAETNPDDGHEIFPVGKAGSTFTAGLIYAVYGPNDEGTASGIRLRYTNAAGWSNYDYYMLDANPAAKSEKAVAVVEEPAVEEPAVEEPVEVVEIVETVEEPEVEVVAPAPAATTTTTKAPATADVSVLFYALAAVSAIGGISAFKRK